MTDTYNSQSIADSINPYDDSDSNAPYTPPPPEYDHSKWGRPDPIYQKAMQYGGILPGRYWPQQGQFQQGIPQNLQAFAHYGTQQNVPQAIGALKGYIEGQKMRMQMDDRAAAQRIRDAKFQHEQMLEQTDAYLREVSEAYAAYEGPELYYKLWDLTNKYSDSKVQELLKDGKFENVRNMYTARDRWSKEGRAYLASQDAHARAERLINKGQTGDVFKPDPEDTGTDTGTDTADTGTDTSTADTSTDPGTGIQSTTNPDGTVTMGPARAATAEDDAVARAATQAGEEGRPPPTSGEAGAGGATGAPGPTGAAGEEGAPDADEEAAAPQPQPQERPVQVAQAAPDTRTRVDGRPPVSRPYYNPETGRMLEQAPARAPTPGRAGGPTYLTGERAGRPMDEDVSNNVDRLLAGETVYGLGSDVQRRIMAGLGDRERAIRDVLYGPGNQTQKLKKLQQISPGFASQVDMISKFEKGTGTGAVSGRGITGLMQEGAKALNPAWTQPMYNYLTGLASPNGAMGKRIANASRFADAVQQFFKDVKELPPNFTKPENFYANLLNGTFGTDPTFSKIYVDLSILAGEAGGLSRTSGEAEADINRLLQAAGPMSSVRQLEATVERYAGLNYASLTGADRIYLENAGRHIPGYLKDDWNVFKDAAAGKFSGQAGTNIPPDSPYAKEAVPPKGLIDRAEQWLRGQ